MTSLERRGGTADRRRIARGGRRTADQPGQHPRILVADSYDGARIPCAKYLSRLGFHVVEAGGGDEAFSHLDQMTPHVILIEQGLPNAPVAQIARRLAQFARAVPVIVMTSDLDDGAASVAGLPLVSVLAKPFSLTTMLEEIRRHLGAQPPVLAETPV